MKTYEEIKTEFEAGKEYSREDVKLILDSFHKYNDTIAQLIAQFERIFLIAGEASGYSIDSLCANCAPKE